MKNAFFLFLALFLASCGSDTEENKATPPPSEDSTELYGDYDGGDEPEEGPAAPEIGRNKLHPGKLVINGSFEADSVLKKIFPGTYNDAEGPNGIWWNCKNCERTELFYNYFTEPESGGWFPDSSFNTTATWSDDTLILGEKTYRVLTFFHTNQPEIEFVSRFEGAPTGVAMFRQENNKYTLEYFGAVLGTFGSFKTPTAPGVHPVEKNQVLLDFSYGNGGAGAEYTTVTEMFLPEKGGFKKVLLERYLVCSNTGMGEWSTEIVPADTLSINGPCDMVFITEGWVDGASLNEMEDGDDLYYFKYLSPELEARAKQAKSAKEKFHFRLTRNFHYNGTIYTCTKSETAFSTSNE